MTTNVPLRAALYLRVSTARQPADADADRMAVIAAVTFARWPNGSR